MGIAEHRDGLRNDQDDPFRGRFYFASPSRIVQEEGVVPMRIPRLLPGLLILGAGLGGCSQTGPLYKAENSDVRTTATIGDEPVSIVAGVPGDGPVSRAGDRSTDQPRTSGGRISGRVFDEQNQPVANARVRLAVGGEPGGKAVFATTDRSGAFTLRGLRPGSQYTLIAEYQGEQGMMSGRADADAPDADVRIGLHLRDAGIGGGDGILAARPSGTSLKPISRSAEFDEIEDEEELPARNARARLNREDLGSMADPDDEYGDFQDQDPSAARSTPRPRTESQYRDEFLDDWDDEENPLPPARELSEVDDFDERSARGRGERTRVARVEDEELPPAAEFESEARTVRPEAFAPIMLDDPDPYPRPIETVPPARTRPRPAEDDFEESMRSDPPSLEPRRPTWGEVTSRHQEIPVDESLLKTAAKEPKDATPPDSDMDRELSTAEVAETVETPPSEETSDDREPLVKRKPGPYCEFDAGERRLIDFALPDASGRMVSLRDFDADLILLDFWGTWCAPCRKSIPHLKELQASLGDKKLQVIGIACERTPADERAAKVAEVVKENGINYAVLITGMDGACPVQEALSIQFYPTMILLDREGRILLREQGATDATLARMDRFIAKNLERDKPALAADDEDDAARR